MSTLKVATIQDTSGNNSSTPEQVAQGRAKAWANFNGTGTVAIRDDFNVSSLTDNGTGDYTLTLTTATADVNGAAMVSGSRGAVPNTNFCRKSQITQLTTTTIRINTWDSASSKEDHSHVTVALFGD